MAHILLISDSRGRGLKAKIQSFTSQDLEINYEEIVLPGATLETIYKRITRSRRRQRTTWDLIIINAGICNFTNRKFCRGNRYLEYTTSKLDETRKTIDQILENFGTQVHICTITPASLAKYSTDRPEETPQVKEEQDHLLKDIEEVNQHIVDRNIQKDCPTINLASNTYTRTLKKQGNKRKRIEKFSPKELEDGVHPTQKLQDIWAKLVATTIPKLLPRH